MSELLKANRFLFIFKSAPFSKSFPLQRRHVRYFSDMKMITWTEEVLLGFLVEVFQIHIQQLRDVKWHEVSARTGIPIEKCQ